eukprot:5448906-Prymnesium_polylepis.1
MLRQPLGSEGAGAPLFEERAVSAGLPCEARAGARPERACAPARGSAARTPGHEHQRASRNGRVESLRPMCEFHRRPRRVRNKVDALWWSAFPV